MRSMWYLILLLQKKNKIKFLNPTNFRNSLEIAKIKYYCFKETFHQKIAKLVLNVCKPPACPVFSGNNTKIQKIVFESTKLKKQLSLVKMQNETLSKHKKTFLLQFNDFCKFLAFFVFFFKPLTKSKLKIVFSHPHRFPIKFNQNFCGYKPLSTRKS